MKITTAITLAAGFAAISFAAEKPVDCSALATRVEATAIRSKADPIELLQLIDQEVSAHPGCACEIVKAAIMGTDCDDAIVGYVVETAVRSAPEHMRLIAQCAIATAPDSLARVQEVIARLDPSAGIEGESAKDSKGIEVKAGEEPANPLDMPVIMVPPIPPVVNPPPSTTTDFLRRGRP